MATVRVSHYRGAPRMAPAPGRDQSDMFQKVN
jgi:hypothetical protein